MRPHDHPPNPSALDRVAIAQDALEQVQAGTVTAYTGAYFWNPTLPRGAEYGPPHEALAGCYVCAVGSLLAALVARLPKDRPIGNFSRIWRALTDAFPRGQIDLIESCFEGENSTPDDLGHRYTGHFPGPGERLVAILENIIRNEGTFRPEQDVS